MRDMIWRGHQCVSIENAVLRAVFVASKGCDLIELTHKPTDTELLAQMPYGLPDPGDRPSVESSSGPFRDRFAGGWYVMLPSGPEPGSHRGAAYGHHGEATLLAFDVDVIEDREERVEILFSARLRRTPLLFERRVSIEVDSATLAIVENVCNEADQPVELIWGHHPTFGGAFIDGATVHIPSVGPSVMDEADLELPGPPIQLSDFRRISDLPEGWFAITNDHIGIGVALRWDETLFPALGLWRMLGMPDYPWWGGRLVALEPATDLASLADAVARGTAFTLTAGEVRFTRLEATLFARTGPVTRVAWGGGIE